MKATPAQIKKWKQDHGEVHQIDVPLDDEGKKIATGYFKKPNLEIMSAAAKYAESDPVKSGSVLFENCWLDGDQQLKNNDEAKLSAIAQLGQLFKVRAASIKKL